MSVQITTKTEDDRLLVALALAMVDNPRATLMALAKMVGVSKATLYRFCLTREELLDRLMSYGAELMRDSLTKSMLDSGTTVEALRRLIQGQLAHREISTFLMHYWKPDTLEDPRGAASWLAYMEFLDAFFLKGQREGAFRIDISAPALTEAFISLLTGAIDAERRGRIARASLATTVEALFLNGAAQ